MRADLRSVGYATSVTQCPYFRGFTGGTQWLITEGARMSQENEAGVRGKIQRDGWPTSIGALSGKQLVVARLCRLRLMHRQHPQRTHDSIHYGTGSIQAVRIRDVKRILPSSFT
jgi:hypothetical protein